jgi:hypothetical protein
MKSPLNAWRYHVIEKMTINTHSQTYKYTYSKQNEGAPAWFYLNCNQASPRNSAHIITGATNSGWCLNSYLVSLEDVIAPPISSSLYIILRFVPCAPQPFPYSLHYLSIKQLSIRCNGHIDKIGTKLHTVFFKNLLNLIASQILLICRLQNLDKMRGMYLEINYLS